MNARKAKNGNVKKYHFLETRFYLFVKVYTIGKARLVLGR
jgi:hypothetical protein